MAQDLPPTGGYEPVQYKVFEYRHNFHNALTDQTPAQPARPRFPPFILPPRGRGDHDLRSLQIWKGSQGTQVREYDVEAVWSKDCEANDNGNG